MTDKTDSKEREALVREICRAVAELPDRNSPEDWPEAMLVTHEELADIVRASLAASAGSEPMFWVRLCSDGLYEGPIHNARIEEVRRQSGAWSPLYLHPSPPEGMVGGWMPIETAPKNGRTLLLGYFNSAGKWRTTRGQWMSQDYIDEYAEDPDFMSPGWHETTVEDDDGKCWPIDPTDWMPLPPPPTTSAGSGKGE